MIDHRVRGERTMGEALATACEEASKRWPCAAGYAAWWRDTLEALVKAWDDPRLPHALLSVVAERLGDPRREARPSPQEIAGAARQWLFPVNETSVPYDPVKPEERSDSAAKLRAYRQRHGMVRDRRPGA